MKRILFLAFLLLISFPVWSQTQFGLKGGLNFTFFNENQSQFGEQAQVDVGYFGGVYLNVPISEKVHFQPEALYNRIGEFNLINAPLYVEYQIDSNLSLLLGPSLNYFFDIFTNNFKVRGDVSAAYAITEGFELNLKYTQGFDELSPNIILLGVGFPL